MLAHLHRHGGRRSGSGRTKRFRDAQGGTGGKAFSRARALSLSLSERTVGQERVDK